MGITKMSKVGFTSTSYLKSDSFLVGNAAFNPPAYESIQTEILTGTQATITFSSIPQTFKHLQLRVLSKSSYTGANTDSYKFRFNGDNGSNYAFHNLEGLGSGTPSAAGSASQNFAYGSYISATSSNADMFNGMVYDILDYTSTTKNKTTRYLSGADFNGSGFISFGSQLWFATPAAITSMTIVCASGSFVQYSSFALYGIKG